MPDAVTTTPAPDPAPVPTPAEVAAKTAPTAPVEPETPAAEAISDDLGDAGKAALQKERAARDDLTRQLAESKNLQQQLADKVREFEDRDKSEQQKLADQVATLQKQIADKDLEVAQAQHASLRAAVAAEEGVPISGLTGATKEELVASAKELIAWRDAAAAASAVKRPPKSPAPAGLKSGASSTGDTPTDKKERAAMALRQLASGT